MRHFLPQVLGEAEIAVDIVERLLVEEFAKQLVDGTVGALHLLAALGKSVALAFEDHIIGVDLEVIKLDGDACPDASRCP